MRDRSDQCEKRLTLRCQWRTFWAVGCTEGWGEYDRSCGNKGWKVDQNRSKGCRGGCGDDDGGRREGELRCQSVRMEAATNTTGLNSTLSFCASLSARIDCEIVPAPRTKEEMRETVRSCTSHSESLSTLSCRPPLLSRRVIASVGFERSSAFGCE